MRRPFKNTSVIMILAVFVFTGVFGLSFLFAPKSAQAQLPVTDVANLAPNSATALGSNLSAQEDVRAGTFELITKAFINSAALAILNAGHYFAQKLAYDAANYIASGGKGQKPFFTTDGLGDHVRNTALDAAGEALGTLSQFEGFQELGINLCNPTSPRVALNIKLGFLNGLPGQLGGPISPGQPKPRCEWNQIESNWNEFTNLDSDTVLSQAGAMFTRGQSSLGAAVEFNRYSFNLINQKQEEAIDKYVANSGFKDKLSKVSGKVLTPAQTIQNEMNRVNASAAEKGEDLLVGFTPEAFGKGAFGILPAALQTFVNTLGEKLMNRVFERGLIALSDVPDNSTDLFDFDANPSGGGRQAAELANADLLTPKIFTSTDLDELTEFVTCPSEIKGLNNCVMDQQFFNGVNRSTHGTPITVRQALEQGFLRGEWRLLPQAHPKNGSRNCYREAYCHSNLVKLRRARVIPAGWELAANSSFNNAADPVTLEEVVDRFNDCPVNADGTVDESKLPDPLHPWCRLIDPNWVLKYPEAICRQEAPGPQLLNPSSTIRGRTCVDSTSCIQEDADGKCIGGFGYCVQESTFWKMDADSCPSQYASCETVRRADGREFSYLMNTTRTEVCNSENAGCREYSRVQNAVSNGGFEDILNGEARAWSSASGPDRTGSNSLRGRNALIVNAGAFASQDISSVLEGAQYTLSASALAADGASSGSSAVVTARFFDRAGSLIVPSDGFTTTCDTTASGDGVTFDILLSDLGYTTAGCDVTSPDGAVSAEMSLFTNGDAYFDEIGMVGDSFSADPLDSVFLNAEKEECPSGQAGCTELVRASTATLNLLRNSGFEDPRPGQDLPQFWSMDPNGYEENLFEGFEGGSSVALSSTPVTQEADGLVPEATYSFSAYSLYEGSDASPGGTASLTLFDTDGNVVPAAPVSTSLIPATTCTRSGSDLVLDLATGEEYARANCQFTTPSDIDSVAVELTGSVSSGTLRADAVQLELSVEPTGYHDGYPGGAEQLHLKLPPKGLNCTGSPADPDICSSFAPSCRKSDVGCNLYTPTDGGNAVPAITASGDTCPAQCSGYDTFREEPTNFTGEEFPVFFIPSTANACTASEAGCEEFTNLETLAEGGESREYFTSIRLCSEPDQETATFYTWEGSDEEGFQLRTWRLRESNVESPATGEAGSDPTGGTGPCTNLEYTAQGQPQCADDLAADNLAACSRSEMLFDPDCREFYDTEGNIHYRLFSKTIVATQDCTEYRMTRADQDDCQATGGFWTGTECHYFGLAEASATCRPAANGCRAYTGNASRNVRVILNDTFEGGTTQEWFASSSGDSTGVINSNESVTAGGHSLRSTSDVVTKDVSGDVRRGKSYLLTFWAKGDADLEVAFSDSGDAPFTYDRANEQDVPVPLTTEWRVYTVGPVEITGSPVTDPSDPSNNEQLAFTTPESGSPQFFLDNIELREVAESIYVVKDSWETPAVCDQAPNGNAAPQFHLGCRAYTDKDGDTAHLKSFSRLCSQEAVGCEAFYHTQNSDSPFGQTFNAVCEIGTACDPGGGTTCDCTVGGETVCQVQAGSTSCQYDADEPVDPVLTTDGGHVSPDGDTALVPDDELVYLINSSEFRCDSANASCSQLGLRNLNQDRDVITSWETVTVKADPDRYGDILCTEEENFCQAYTRKVDGASLYFKDPDNHTCEYRENVSIDGFSYNGWFKKDLNEPCYDDFLEAGNAFGIWKNSDPQYDGWVGTCSPNHDQCKEFIDPVDTSNAHPEGRPYYAIMNDRLDTRTCQGRVSLQTSPRAAQDASACVLFRRSDDLRLKYDAAATYDRSDEENGALVDTVSTAGGNDTNIVIRVQRDRRCSQWLDCRTSETVFNDSTGEFQNVCTSFGVCDKFEKVGDSTQCVNFVDPEDRSVAGEVLDLAAYQKREVGRDGVELSGYAVPNRYPVNELVTMNIAPSGDPKDMRLVRVGGSCDGQGYGELCGEVNNRGNRGTCLGAGDPLACTYPIDGSRGLGTNDNLNLDRWEGRYPSTSCRAYPQEDAPFPSSVADPNGWDDSARPLNAGNPVLSSPPPAFEGANVCQRRIDPETGKEYDSCECSYQIARYGDRTSKKYFSIQDSNLPRGYCQGGSFDGYECDPRAIGVRGEGNLSCCTEVIGEGDIFGGGGGCASGASCRELSKIDRVVGYEGQCLERDLANPINGSFDEFACATWRPVGIVGGTRDIYNLNRTAGYFAPPDKKYYCVGNQTTDQTVENGVNRPVFPLEMRDKTPGWSVTFTINYDTDFFDEDDFRDGVLGPFHDQDTSPDQDLGGSSKIGPEDQLTNLLFGPGEISKFIQFGHSGRNCHKQDGDNEKGAFCIYPGLSTFVDEGEDGEDGGPGREVLTGEALGILGCYEVADDNIGEPATIEHPYIGPPIYRDQLLSFEFGLRRDIYVNETNEEHNPTNPFQRVWRGCNDEEDGWFGSGIRSNEEADSIVNNSFWHIYEGNDWQVDASGGGGQLQLGAVWNSDDTLKSIKIAATDNSDEGTFGINSLTLHFRQGCESIARVDEQGEFGLTKAFTDHLNAFANYSDSGAVTISSFDESCRPWGAIGSIAAEPPSKPWTYVVDRPEKDNACLSDAFRKGVPYERDIDNPNVLDSIRHLFRQVFSVWDYRTFFDTFTERLIPQDETYVDSGEDYDDRPFMTTSAIQFPETSDGDLIPFTYRVPRVASVAVDNCDPDGNCSAGAINAITINSRSEGVISAQNGMLNSIAKFYGWAHHNAMPILERTLIWGDFQPKEPSGKGWYKNQKPFCSAGSGIGVCDGGVNAGASCVVDGECSGGTCVHNDAVGECNGAANEGLTCITDDDCPGSTTCNNDEPNHFGNTPGACTPRPFQFEHVYTCSLDELESLDECDGPDDAADNAPCYRELDTDNDPATDPSPACVYRPAVQIKDNWGWCNCTGDDCPVDGGMHETDNGGEGCSIESADPDALPYTRFQGEVRVFAKPEDAAVFSPGGGSGGFPFFGGGGGFLFTF